MLPSRFMTTLTVTRKAVGQHIDGRWQDGATSTLTVRASVQPETSMDGPRRRFVRAGGVETEALIVLYSDVALRPTDEHAGIIGDRFTWEGLAYEVAGVEHQSQTGLAHYKAMAALVARDEVTP